MELEIKTIPTELEGFKPGEVAKLKYNTKQVVTFLKESPNKAEALDTVYNVKDFVACDIFKKCAICQEDTAMNSNDYRAQGVFVCEKCRNAVMHIRNILENGGSVT